jgi:hypothetical protein
VDVSESLRSLAKLNFMCRLRFGTGTYEFRATFNYPQLDQLSSSEVLNNASQGLVKESPDLTTSLSFLSYSNKLLAGSWRFLTYFGRDSMLSALLMQDILSQGEGSALEAVIGAVIERINKTDGTVCHEENLGDYASFLARQKGIDSSAPSCDYKMVDTDFLFPILMKDYFVNTDTGKSRAALFLNRKATFLEENAGIAYSDLAQRTAEKIMSIAAPFVSSQTASNTPERWPISRPVARLKHRLGRRSHSVRRQHRSCTRRLACNCSVV